MPWSRLTLIGFALLCGGCSPQPSSDATPMVEDSTVAPADDGDTACVTPDVMPADDAVSDPQDPDNGEPSATTSDATDSDAAAVVDEGPGDDLNIDLDLGIDKQPTEAPPTGEKRSTGERSD